MNKPLTTSQQQHLSDLIIIAQTRAKAVQEEIDRFVEYLRNEHGAPAQKGWTLDDIQVGFVLPQKAASPETPQLPTPNGGEGSSQ